MRVIVSLTLHPAASLGYSLTYSFSPLTDSASSVGFASWTNYNILNYLILTIESAVL